MNHVKPYWHIGQKEQCFLRTITGRCDSSHATILGNETAVSSIQVFLNDSPIMTKSFMQKVITLSVMEVELYAPTFCAQDMLFVYQMMPTMEFTVKLPMILECNNKGTINLLMNIYLPQGGFH